MEIKKYVDHISPSFHTNTLVLDSNEIFRAPMSHVLTHSYMY